LAKLDKDLKKVGRLEKAAYAQAQTIALPALAAIFLLAVLVFASLTIAAGPFSLYVVVAAVIGGYLALNIGANDVANNMGPAVGGRAMTLGAALFLAAICEAAGALIAGGDVVTTVSRNIVTPPAEMETLDFILLMMAAFLAAALWINLATILSAPVSTTHSVIGGVLGAAVAAAGPAIISWPVIGAIVASWVISPAMGGVIAAAFLGFIKWAILYREDRLEAARRFVPALIGVMAGVFAMYLTLKGLSRVWRAPTELVLLFGVVAFAAGWLLTRPWVERRVKGLENRRKHVSSLFVVPLIFATGLLSFAHGANDVANAVGPLAAIVAAAERGVASPENVVLPLWVLAIGALGLAVGLLLFGPRLIRMVGEKITRMDAIRAFCVALSAAITVLVASALGLPVSSTHIAIGGVFGVGFLREAITNRKKGRKRKVQPIAEAMADDADQLIPGPPGSGKREKRKLVRRRHLLTIVAAWVITVPASASLAAALYLAMRLAADL
jgi:inorganic phosphate transporter, PiT family